MLSRQCMKSIEDEKHLIRRETFLYRVIYRVIDAVDLSHECPPKTPLPEHVAGPIFEWGMPGSVGAADTQRQIATLSSVYIVTKGLACCISDGQNLLSIWL